MITVNIIDGERQREAFSNPVISWYYSFEFGPRFQNRVKSTRTYKSPDIALVAGERQLKNLLKAALTQEDSK